jgi:hypothetical protein
MLSKTIFASAAIAALTATPAMATALVWKFH